ncbi:SpoIIE family protein phosphatase [Streptomyces sp. NPDC049577]|uniref:SpoIIE family protein phosphatase n=1 Tax=Streptomyces sp. NPDC049577 TaxID=3155153 RepID=UPI00341E4AFF
MRRTGASAGGIYLLAPDEPALRLAVTSGVPAKLAEPWRRLPLTATTPVVDAVREDRLVWIGSREELARSYPLSAVSLPFPFVLAAAPVSDGTRPWGTLLLLWPGSRPPHSTGRERANITSSGRRIAVLLAEATRTTGPPAVPDEPYDVTPRGPRAEPRNAALAAADFAERLPGGSLALDLESRITFLTRSAARLLGRDAEHLLGTVPWQALPWLDRPEYEDRYRAAVISREPMAFTALRPPDRWLDIRLYPDAGGISVRIVPARDPADGGPRPRPRPVPADRPGPSTEGPAAGRIYQLMHLAAALTEAVGIQDVVDMVAEQVMPAFGAEGLVLSAADAGRLKITGHRGYAPHIIEGLDGLPVDTTVTPAGDVLAAGAPLFFPDRDEMGESYPEALALSDKQAWAYLPLIVSGRTVGCCILSYDHPHDFSSDERAVLTSLAGLIAQALDRARLYDAKSRLAQGLQQALLPRSLPRLPGLDAAARYLPATLGMDIGGDFYDLVPLGGGDCGAVIGDVQGHNVAAAALMGQVRSAVRAHAATGAPPDQVLGRTNRLLVDLDPGLLVSCLYAHLDLGRRRAAIASAGHPPPILRRAGHRAYTLHVEPGPLLGIDPDTAYPVTELALSDGALLVLYTDGLVETQGTDIEENTDDLAHHLAGADDHDLDALIDRLLRFARPTGQHTDDIAVLVLRTGGAPAG